MTLLPLELHVYSVFESVCVCVCVCLMIRWRTKHDGKGKSEDKTTQMAEMGKARDNSDRELSADITNKVDDSIILLIEFSLVRNPNGR